MGGEGAAPVARAYLLAFLFVIVASLAGWGLSKLVHDFLAAILGCLVGFLIVFLPFCIDFAKKAAKAIRTQTDVPNQ